MHIVKLLSLVFLSLYLLIVSLNGLGVDLGFVPGVVTNLLAFGAGVLFMVRAFKGHCHQCHSDDVRKP